ncbi:hypothetical protein C8J57DRAFT_992396, partial [Mycena rebaudengoi]
RKVRPAPLQPYKRSGRPPKASKDTPKTSAKPADDGKRKNLTNYDWLNVFAFKDDHPDMGQEDIAKHFRTLATSNFVLMFSGTS